MLYSKCEKEGENIGKPLHRQPGQYRERVEDATSIPHSPGEAHSRAGCPPATHGHHTEQISTCSHGGAHGAAVDVSWRRLQSMEPSRSSSGLELPPMEISLQCSRRTGGAATHGAPCWCSVWKAAACGRPHRVSSGRMVSMGGTNVEQGQRVIIKVWQKQNDMD